MAIAATTDGCRAGDDPGRRSVVDAAASCDIHLLGLRARVVAPATVLQELSTLLPSGPTWAPTAPASANVEIRLAGDPAHPGRQQLIVDGKSWWRGADEELLPALEWVITSAAIERLGATYLLCHGGAVAAGEAGILLSGPPGSGKTTLLAALVAAGLTYLGDEIAAVDLATGRIAPHARSMCLKAGSRELLAEHYPALAAPPSRRFAGEAVWYLPPPPAAWPAAPVPARYLIFPRYRPGAPAALTRTPRPEALQRLLVQCFSPAAFVQARLGRIVELLRGLDCYTLSGDRLEAAVALIRQLAT